MTTIYLIRHAEAEGNLYRRIQGHYDCLVTENGDRQIAALEARFRDIHIDAVYASDLYRTRKTAESIYKTHGLPLHATERLREMCLGAWEDRTWGEVERETPDQLRLFNNDPERWDIPGRESLRSVQERMRRVILDIADAHDGGCVAVFSHGASIRCLCAAILGIPSAEFPKLPYCENASVTLLEVDNGKITIRYMNDAEHLPEENRTLRRQSWWKNGNTGKDRNLWYKAMDLSSQADTYRAYRRDGWMAVHGTMRGYADVYLDVARQHHAAAPEAVAEAYLGKEPVGMIELAPERGVDEKIGAIAFYYMRAPYRGQSLGIQLLGHAVSFYRARGRERLQLRVAEDNAHAIGFYRHYGFRVTGEVSGALGRLLVMEKSIKI